MSEESTATDALLIENKMLRDEIAYRAKIDAEDMHRLQERYGHLHRQFESLQTWVVRGVAERDRALADVAQFRRVVEAVASFWRNDPLAFGDEATPNTLAVRFSAIGRLACDTLELSSPGGAILAELAAARAALDQIDRHVIGAYTTEEGSGANVEPCEECGEMREIAAQALAVMKKAGEG